jgi:hypothetical protein
MTEEVKDLVYRETTKEVLSQTARDLGMQDLQHSGYQPAPGRNHQRGRILPGHLDLSAAAANLSLRHSW